MPKPEEVEVGGPHASKAFPQDLVVREKELIGARRKALGERGPELARPAIGLALSGGGIRSATFA
ncbi:MAG TPA: hypothetical protein VMW35_05965, partial [Myxococcota bacterium]|nr:hypothetical protein [Myxococcota bacterium]